MTEDVVPPSKQLQCSEIRFCRCEQFCKRWHGSLRHDGDIAGVSYLGIVWPADWTINKKLSCVSHPLAGCPAAVGNLWDVTDRDIDRFSKAVLDEWTKTAGEEDGSCMAKAIADGRKKCRLTHLIGAAPVCYGLPTVVCRSANALLDLQGPGS